MKRIVEHVIPPKRGHGLVVTRGQHLRIIDLEGKQVVDMALFNAENLREKLSTSNSRTRYIPKPGAEYVPRDLHGERRRLFEPAAPGHSAA